MVAVLLFPVVLVRLLGPAVGSEGASSWFEGVSDGSTEVSVAAVVCAFRLGGMTRCRRSMDDVGEYVYLQREADRDSYTSYQSIAHARLGRAFMSLHGA